MRCVRQIGIKSEAAVVGLALFFALFFARGAVARAEPRNSCGCYRDDGGTCYCDKKAKCGCPGDCEPKGCEEKRDKELQKQIEAEEKKAAAAASERKPQSSGDDESDNTAAPPSDQVERPATPRKKPRLSPAQARELGKLIDLYLSDHPDARGRSVEEVRSDVAR
jgi:hypothetical protein